MCMQTSQEFIERINDDIVVLSTDFELPEFENLRISAMGWDHIVVEVDVLDDGGDEDICTDIANCMHVLFGEYATLFRFEVRIRSLQTMEEVEIEIAPSPQFTINTELSLPKSIEYYGWDSERRDAYRDFFSSLMN